MHQLMSPTLHGFNFMICILMFWSALKDGDAGFAAFSALVIYLLMWIIQFAFNAIYLAFPRNKSVLTKHTLEILDDAFLEETKFNKTFSYWPGVIKAVDCPGFVAIYVSPHLAHIIPNRAFSTKDERAQFLSLTREKIYAFSKA